MRSYYNVVMSGQPIRASDIQTLRDYVQDDLNTAGLTFPWTWTTVSPGMPIEAKHLTEIRGAIQKLWDALNAGDLPPWQTAEGTQAQAAAASDLPSSVLAPNVVQGRTWLNQYESQSIPIPLQGVDSLTFRPADPNSPEISTAWANDARNISTKVVLVRSIITSRLVDPTDPLNEHREILSGNDGDLITYKRSFDKYQSGGRNLKTFLVFNRETYYPGPTEPNAPISDPLPPDQFPPPDATNLYIEGFAAEVKKLIDAFRPANMDTAYIIWNEPNDFKVAKRLEPFTFGALLHRVWQECAKGQANPPLLYPAGIQTVIGHPGSATDYLDPAIRYVRYRMDSAGESGWPWSGLNFHFHQQRDPSEFAIQIKNISDLRTNNSQDGDLLIGEWGVNVANASNLSVLHDQLVSVSEGKPTKMFYFSHQAFVEDGVQWGCEVVKIDPASDHYEYQPDAQTALYSNLQNAP